MENIILQEKMLKAVGASGVKISQSGTATITSADIINAAYADATVEVVVDWTGAGATETISLDKGQTLWGRFTSIKVTAGGPIVAY